MLRKTPVVIGFEQDGEIRVGDGALALKVRAPTRCFFGLMQLLGEKFTSQTSQLFLAQNPQFDGVMVETKSGTVGFKVSTLPPSLFFSLMPTADFFFIHHSRFSTLTLTCQVSGIEEVLSVEILLALYIRSLRANFVVGDIPLDTSAVTSLILVIPEYFTAAKVCLVSLDHYTMETISHVAVTISVISCLLLEPPIMFSHLTPI